MNKIIGKPFGRRAVLAGGAAALSMPFIVKSSLADAKAFRISLPGNEEEWQAKNLQQFKKSLDASLPGQFDVQIHYNGTLFGQGTEIEAMQRGNLEVGMVSPQDISALIPEYSVFTCGYLMRDPAHLDAVYDGDIGAEYKARIEKDIGITLVKSQYLGTRHVILREPKEVNKPEDLAGLKLRMPGSEAWQFLGNALGANATPLAFEEVYLAMQTGTIDGLENPLPDAMASKFYEVSKQIVLTSHMVANTFFAVASEYWNGLSDEQRAAITAAEVEGKKVNDDGVAATEKDAVAFMEGKGLKVTTPDVAAFRAKVLDAFVNSDFSKDWPAGMLDRIKAA
ncbi:MAG: TRAP transporter substrate-binding protein DctP [Rhodospirillaceae bacterium]|jgi:tripartite ATP-independent transporter DctP family solute receptor|nr:TRAP transporter substrate-binding protein DctP [Rhodospirillaceae bacterium]